MFKRHVSHKRPKFQKRRFAKKAKRTWRKKAGHRSVSSNIATSTETSSGFPITGQLDTGTAAASFQSVRLADYPRSLAVSANYRFYRITKVTYDYMPNSNTYQAGLTMGETVPRFISVMCRDGNFIGATAGAAGTVADLLEMGGKFRPFLKPIKVSYVPNIALATNVLTNNGDIGTLPASYVTRKKMPWLSTLSENTGATPSGSGANIFHFGHQWSVVQTAIVLGEVIGIIKTTVHFEFKQPLSSNT